MIPNKLSFEEYYNHPPTSSIHFAATMKELYIEWEKIKVYIRKYESGEKLIN
jgi:hypothetical protein